METISDLIDHVGGTSAVAGGLNLTPSTVSSWKTSGRIPAWRRPGLIEFASAAGKPIDDQRIARAEQASKAAQVEPEKARAA